MVTAVVGGNVVDMGAGNWAARRAGRTGVSVSSYVTAGDWDAYVAGHPDATVDHLWAWKGVFGDVFGHDSEYLVARRDDRVVGVLPLVLFQSRLFGRSVVSLPFLNDGGVLSADGDAARALLDRARTVAAEFRAGHLELRHRRRQFPTLPVREHKLGFTRTLPATREGLWESLDRKVRNQVRKAQKEGLTTQIGGVELVGEFYQVFSRNMRDLGTPVYSRRLFEQTLRVLSGRATVFVVRLRDRAVASAVALSFRDTVLVPWASSLRGFRHLCPNMLLYWTMLERAVDAGAGTFDFGRSSPGTGPHHFKLQWGASPTPLPWEYVLLDGGTLPARDASDRRFRTAVAVWSRLPMWLANTAGPSIVRQIP
jgi:FemAB-related protein (PEP-CTERM system-associated)